MIEKAYKKRRFLVMLLLFMLAFAVFVSLIQIPQTNAQTNVVTTAEIGSPTAVPRQSFRDDTYHYFWLFYPSGNVLYYTSSSNGTTWGGGTSITTLAGNGWWHFDVYYAGGTTINLAFYNSTALYYVSGTLGSGTISFGTMYSVDDSATMIGVPSLTVDTNGYPWLAYYTYDGCNVTKATTTSGSSWGIPTRFSDTSGMSLYRQSSGKIYALYMSSNHYPIYGRLFNGSDWESEQITVNDFCKGYWYSAVVDNNWNIHVANFDFANHDDDIAYSWYNATSKTWTDPFGLAKAGAPRAFLGGITINSTSQDLYVWYFRSDIVYYRKNVGGSWWSETVAWNRTGNAIYSDCFTVYANTSDSYVGGFWLEGSGSPFNIVHGDLGITDNAAPGAIPTFTPILTPTPTLEVPSPSPEISASPLIPLKTPASFTVQDIIVGTTIILIAVLIVAAVAQRKLKRRIKKHDSLNGKEMPN